MNQFKKMRDKERGYVHELGTGKRTKIDFKADFGLKPVLLIWVQEEPIRGWQPKRPKRGKKENKSGFFRSVRWWPTKFLIEFVFN